MNVKVQQSEQWSDAVRTDLGDIVGSAGKAVLACVAVFAAWALFIPLNSAVVAPGYLVSEGHNQLMQHRSGGAIKAIHAREGDLVEKGALVIELDPQIDQAQLTKLRSRFAALHALKLRLEAEKQMEFGHGSFDLALGDLRGGIMIDPTRTSSHEQDGNPGSVADAGLQRRLNAEQSREFEKGRRAIEAEVQALVKQAESLRSQQRGQRDRAARIRRQVSLLRGQFAAAEKLVRGGHIAKQQMWDLESRLLQSEAELADVEAQIDAATSTIAETDARIRRVRLSDERATSQQLTEVLAEIGEISDQLAAAEQARFQTAIRAPAKGILVRFDANTIGGLIAPGDTVGEIVPAEGPLEVQARVAPQDIGSIAIGQEAEIQISALNPRIYEAVPAAVTYIAADSSVDERTGERFFEVRARLDDGMSKDLRAQLTPGMAGDVFLLGRSRTFAAYLFQPFTDSLTRSFRETK